MYSYSTNLKRDITYFANLIDPFEQNSGMSKIDHFDNRVPIISQLCQSLWNKGGNVYEWYAATINLWYFVERKNQITQL